MLKPVKKGLYAKRYFSGKRENDFRFVVVEDPEVWLNDENGVVGTMVVYRAYQGLDNIRQCMLLGKFKATFNFVTSNITTKIERTEQANLAAIRRYQEAHADHITPRKPRTKKAAKKNAK